MKTQYSPSPWKWIAIQKTGDLTLRSASDQTVLTISKGTIPMIQDRFLLEAAPELLIALKTILAFVPEDDGIIPMQKAAVDAALSAIRKAHGQ